METNKYIQENIDWIASGKIGCVFASALVKQREKIGWKFFLPLPYDEYMKEINSEKSFIISIVFPYSNVNRVKNFALHIGMHIEDIEGMYEGLRLKLPDGNVSWVQYFGPDSHVKTRQSPHPMLSYCIKLPTHIYAKTMAKGILHLAHASIEFLTAKKADTLWDQSFAKTKKELGHIPTLKEAAKTTFLKQ